MPDEASKQHSQKGEEGRRVNWAKSLWGSSRKRHAGQAQEPLRPKNPHISLAPHFPTARVYTHRKIVEEMSDIAI